MIHRPRTMTADERGAARRRRCRECCVPAPSVIEFDGDGNVVQAWGGPGHHPSWPENEHGIYVDHKDNVWIAGNGANDHVLLKFTRDGRFLLQIGRKGETGGSNDPDRLGRPADVEVDPATNEIFVADGYGNRRVIVFDAETGAYKRHWGAYGERPPADDKLPAYQPGESATTPARFFRNPVHCVRLAKDGLLYVCDRANDRIQVFRKDGTFVQGVHRRARHARQRLGLGHGFPAGPDAVGAAGGRWVEQRGLAAWGATAAPCSAASGATAAMPANSTGCTTWRSTAAAMSSPPRSIPASGCSASGW